MSTTDLFLNVEAYCVLCRRDLTLSQGDDQDNENDDRFDSDKWESNVIAFFDGGFDDDRTRLHVFSQPNLSGSWPGVDGRAPVILRLGTDDEWIRVSFGSQPEQNDDSTYPRKLASLYFVHTCCWQAVRIYYDSDGDRQTISFQQIHQLASATESILPRSFCGNEAAVGSPIILPQQLHNDQVAKALSHILALPVELQQMIVDELGGSMTASLLRVQQTVTLLKRLSTSLGGNIKTESLILRSGGHLVAKTIRLFGQTYLDSVSVVDTVDQSAWDMSIPVRRTTAAVKVYIGAHGVQALTLVYADGSLSPVLGTVGKAKNSFFHNISLIGATTPSLRICQGALKVVYIGRNAEHGNHDEKTLLNTLPSVDGELSILDTVPHPPPRQQGSDGHNRRFCQYLPLRLGDKPATVLTVHCTTEGIVGMTSHFGGDGLLASEDQRHIGRPYGGA